MECCSREPVPDSQSIEFDIQSLEFDIQSTDCDSRPTDPYIKEIVWTCEEINLARSGINEATAKTLVNEATNPARQVNLLFKSKILI